MQNMVLFLTFITFMNKINLNLHVSFVEGVKAKVYIKAQPNYINGRTYLSLQQLKMDFSVKDIRMGVENVHNGNSVLREYLIHRYIMN